METAKRAGGLWRLGAWAVVLCLLLQTLLPYQSALAVSSLDSELAASICHSADDGSDAAPVQAGREHCSFCQIHFGLRLPPPSDPWVKPSEPPVAAFAPAPHSMAGRAPLSLHLPQSRRGPPSAS